jgi:hypothetical protein
MEMKICRNCKHDQKGLGRNGFAKCYDAIGKCVEADKWEAKEKPMSKIEFESEEQYKIIMADLGMLIQPYDIKVAKEKGYIKKSEIETLVEEAEEMYLSNVRPFAMNLENMGVVKEVLQERLDCVHKLYEAVQYLKAENERLKK